MNRRLLLAGAAALAGLALTRPALAADHCGPHVHDVNADCCDADGICTPCRHCQVNKHWGGKR
jgi:hypothetical protein